MKSIFDASFKYTPSVKTDVRKTFERIRREQLAERRGRAMPADADTAVNVVPLEASRPGASPCPPGRASG